MKSYREIAWETGTTVKDVRALMKMAKKREVPCDHYYNDYSGFFIDLADTGRVEIVIDTFWSVRGVRGRTREEAVINALNNEFRA